MSVTPDAAHNSPPETMYNFLLFVAGEGVNSRQAKENLAALCEEELAGKFRLEIVNVLEDFEVATEHRVFLTPALVSLEPGPVVTIIGNLNDRAKVRAALRIGS